MLCKVVIPCFRSIFSSKKKVYSDESADDRRRHKEVPFVNMKIHWVENDARCL
jgi:hypothetical protein